MDLIAQIYANGKGHFLVQSESQIRSRTGKAVNYVRFQQIDSETNKVEEIFKIEIEVNHKVAAKIFNRIVLISLVEGDYSKHKHVIYIYNFIENQYIGYINISEILSLQVYEGRKISALDYSIN